MYALSTCFFSRFPKTSSKINVSLPSNLPLLNFSYVIIQNNQLSLPSSIADIKKTVRKRRPPEGIKLVMSSFPYSFLNSIEKFINKFVDPPTRPSINPNHILSTNFAPVQELPPTDCDILQGTLPPCLDGAYIRNGPNPQHFPLGPYHWFDGDGMLHSIRISNGKARMCSRFVKTYKYKVENEIGFPIFPNMFYCVISKFIPNTAARIALSIARIAAGQFNPSINGFGVANTSLAVIGGKLYALCESDLPYAVKLTPDGDILTVGRQNFDGSLKMNMTAHPKIDQDTRETFAFKYALLYPFLTYFRISPDGKKQQDLPIFSMKSLSFIHDFAVTKRYAIFQETQIGMNPFEIMAGGSLLGTDHTKIPRIGVIPRYATDESEMRWFDVPGLNMLHFINAWDEDDNANSIVIIATNVLSIQHLLERMDLIHSSMEKVRINLESGEVSRFPLSPRSLDFGVINPAYLCRKNKYVYAGIGDPIPKISGVAKLDITVKGRDGMDCIVGSRMFGEGCYGGEPFFVAKEPNNEKKGDEDDGYLICYVHDENIGESRFLVMDAKSSSLEIVTAVKLPQRVPYGFHGLFIRENDLNM